MSFKNLQYLFTGLCLLSAVSINTTPYQFPLLKFFPKMPVNADNPVSYEGIELGRALFYDTILSLNRDISCATCHRQEVAFSDAPLLFSKGSEGRVQKRNTPPLFNLAWHNNFFWDGKSQNIEEQIFHPVRGHEEMDLDWHEAERRIQNSSEYRKMFSLVFPDARIDSVLIARAIAQFERSIISHNSKFDRVLRGEDHFSKDEYEGFVLMNDMTKGNCLHCHPTDGSAITTKSEMSNNGLDPVFDSKNFSDKGYGGITKKEKDMGKFKVPSLRNLLFTAPYMHDGRFNDLEEVLEFYSSGLHTSITMDSRFANSMQNGGVDLSKEEQEKIILFLHTLTDSVLIVDERFSNPFKSRNN